jgi:integrase
MRSTGETDLKRAKIKCDALERMAEESARPDADREWLDRIAEETMRRLGHANKSPTVGEFLATWLESQRGAVSDRTFEKYEQVLRDCHTHLGSQNLQAVRDEDVVRMRDALVRGGRSATTANFAVALLRRCFAQAVEKGLLQRNPVALVRSLREKRTVRGVFTVEQLAQLLKTLPLGKDWYGFILAGWYTGARLGDLQRLQWSNVTLGLHFVSFTQGKTGGTVKIPLHPELEGWLTEQSQILIGTEFQKTNRSLFVFPTLARAITCTLSSQFKRLLVKVGLGGSGLCFHSLRHSFNSELANAGVSQELRQLLTGHASTQINDKYTHIRMDALRDAVSKLPRLS